MPRKKRSKVQEKKVEDELEEMHEKNKVTINVKLTYLEEFALLLYELFKAHEDFERQTTRRRK